MLTMTEILLAKSAGMEKTRQRFSFRLRDVAQFRYSIINVPVIVLICFTYQNPLRVFTNNIVVRFHPGLEIEGDEVITVICRYPPPVVQPPVIPELLQ